MGACHRQLQASWTLKVHELHMQLKSHYVIPDSRPILYTCTRAPQKHRPELCIPVPCRYAAFTGTNLWQAKNAQMCELRMQISIAQMCELHMQIEAHWL